MDIQRIVPAISGINYASRSNAYLYASDSPVRFSDPAGLYDIEVHLGLTHYLAVCAGFRKDYARSLARQDQGMDLNAQSLLELCRIFLPALDVAEQ
jgi:hypothetical protein